MMKPTVKTIVAMRMNLSTDILFIGFYYFVIHVYQDGYFIRCELCELWGIEVA